MNNRIVFTLDEGLTISVIHPAPGILIEDCVRSVPAGAKYKYIDVSVIPSDRTFRDAWEMPVDGTWLVKG